MNLPDCKVENEWGGAKVAFVHDWMVTYGGAERVLFKMASLFSNATIFTLVHQPSDQLRRVFDGYEIVESDLGRIPFARSKYRLFLPVMPYFVEQFDLRDFDIVISSSHAVAKGVITKPEQPHICMCYSPIRYAWDLQEQYLREAGITSGIKSVLARLMLHRIRSWDFASSARVDHFIAISHFIGKRIRKFYRRDSDVVYPIVDTNFFSYSSDVSKGDYFITCSRFVPYKRIDLIVDTFTRYLPELKLKVIGDGPDYQKVSKLAGDNVQLMREVSGDDLRKYLRGARAFVFAAEEDFGIAPVEAQACGVPVIALERGAARETIVGSAGSVIKTGVFFGEQTPESLASAVRVFERDESMFTPADCVSNASRFSEKVFEESFLASLRGAVKNFPIGMR